jgi:hypothetical protein
MRPSYEALPSWLSDLNEVSPTPVRAGRPPDEGGLVRRALRNPRLPLHVAVIAVVLGIGAAAAAGSVRARDTAEARTEMSAVAAGKVAELRAFTTLWSPRSRKVHAPLAPGGSLTDDVPGYFDLVDGTAGRRFRRRWAIEADPGGQRRIAVRVIPTTPDAGPASLDVTAVVREEAQGDRDD